MARYEFLNINPLNEIEEDCVTRAIALAMDYDYGKVARDLRLVAELFDCDKLCVCCYKYLLDYVYDLKRIEEVEGLTINEFADLYSNGVYLVRVNGHLTCIINGTLYDIWNCENEIITNVWKII